MTDTSRISSGTPVVLVVNAGSSSVKYQLIDPGTGTSHAKGLIERIGLEGGVLRHTVEGRTHERSVDVPQNTAKGPPSGCPYTVSQIQALREARLTLSPCQLRVRFY